MEDDDDWPSSFNGLRTLEEELQCSICADFYNNPVLLPCSHTFCSSCIRRYFSSQGFNSCCPTCRFKSSVQDFIPNRSVENIVSLFKKQRHLLLQLANSSSSTLSSSSPLSSNSNLVKKTPMMKMKNLFYHKMKDKEIREVVDQAGLHANNKTRDQLIAIHKEFVLLVNSQQDGQNPKSIIDIVQQVNQLDTDRKKTQWQVQETLKRGNYTSNFEKLKKQIKDNKRKSQVLSNENEDTNNTTSTSSLSSSTSLPEEELTRHEVVLEQPLSVDVESSRTVVNVVQEKVVVGSSRSSAFSLFPESGKEAVEEMKPYEANGSRLPLYNNICHTPPSSPHESISSNNSSGRWNCSRCTLLNKRFELVCKACSWRKGKRCYV